MGRGFPLQPTKGLGSVVSSPSGVGVIEPRPKLNFIQPEYQQSPLMTRIALNCHSKQRPSLLRKTTVIQVLKTEKNLTKQWGCNPHQPFRYGTVKNPNSTPNLKRLQIQLSTA